MAQKTSSQRPRTGRREVAPSAVRQPAPAEQLARTCLNCGRALTELKCKLTCRCGYYASCSDFY